MESGECNMKRINNILIANRGEIASRIIRTCKKMGIKSTVVFSNADRHSLFVSEADQAICIGENEAALSYLDQDKIIQVAKNHEVDAIHPGYGFLSENVSFAKRCQKENIIFIGPSPEAIGAFGSKAEAKKAMEQHDVPTVPGYNGEQQDATTLKKEAKKIGFPILIKASAGGGGKGMRIVENESDFQTALEAVKRESKSAFGNDEVILEKYIAAGRHIEFQIFGDHFGNIIHIFERECSIQRRYQKIIEESPSPALDENLRNKMSAAAIKAAKAINYNNAGTVEFIFDDKTKDFYFLEVNTRLQVEHPVTEEITGLDLVKMQIEVAQGQPILLQQSDIQSVGYAIECRLYAEDPRNNFMPQAGPIHHFKVPEVDGLRIETAVKCGAEVSMFYDPMIAKLIIHASDRVEAARKMKYVLEKLVCQGIVTNQQLLLDIVSNEKFIAGNYTTHFIESAIDLKPAIDTVSFNKSLIAATLFQWSQRNSKRTLLKSMPSGWRSNFYEMQKENFVFQEKEYLVSYKFDQNKFSIKIEDTSFDAQIHSIEGPSISIEINGVIAQYQMFQKEKNLYLHNDKIGNITLQLKDRFPVKNIANNTNEYLTPMPSKVVKVEVQVGQSIKKDAPLIILNSMKMENVIIANEDGIIEEIYVVEGENIEAGVLLLKMK